MERRELHRERTLKIFKGSHSSIQLRTDQGLHLRKLLEARKADPKD